MPVLQEYTLKCDDCHLEIKIMTRSDWINNDISRRGWTEDYIKCLRCIDCNIGFKQKWEEIEIKYR